MSIAEKIIRVSIRLGQENDSWDAKGNDTLVAEGLRTSCQINYGNGALMPSAKIKIYGLKLESMMKLLRVKWNTEQAMLNLVQVEAGTADDMAVVYTGNITFAYPEMGGAPDVCLVIESHTAVLWQLKPAEPLSHDGEVDVAAAIETVCKRMGRRFENNGVNKRISNQYLDGTELEKIRRLAAHADIDVYIDNETVAIAEKGQPRAIDVPVLSPSTGMIGYPIPDLQGVKLRCLYDKALRFGGLIEISGSQIAQCNGRWRVFGISIDLEAKTPGGKWFADIKAANVEDTNVKIAT
ncbi:hypothetical protein L1281_002262 [Neisseria sp. HSC-16F19]|nr:hypothetical protein [Neisseria sp. HSC-16F19]MCP2041651.1 hypothetical protein [Neisseria sp. HSC-16F19]